MPTRIENADLAALVKMFDDKKKAITLLEEDRVKKIAAIDADIKAAQEDLKSIQKRLAELLGVSSSTAPARPASSGNGGMRKRSTAAELARIEQEVLNLMQPGEKYRISEIGERVSGVLGRPVSLVTLRNVLGKLIEDGKAGKEGERSSTVYTRA